MRQSAEEIWLSVKASCLWARMSLVSVYLCEVETPPTVRIASYLP